MILSDRLIARPGRTAEAPAPPAAPEPPGTPEPRALCPSCGRPLVLLRAGSCLYCGAAAPDVAAVASAPALPASKIPAQLLVQLEPRARTRSRGRQWVVRVGAALAGMSAVIILLVGPCRAA